MTTPVRTHAPRAAEPWHASPPDVVAERLDVDPAVGLSAGTAAERLEAHGPNELEQAPRRSSLLLLADQFRDVLVIVLAIAAVLAGVVGDTKDMVVIAAVLVVNAVLGFIQEHRAEQSLAALRSMLSPTAVVRRDGRAHALPAAELVPGDVVLLDAGSRVPADARIVSATGLEVDESALTGESTPVAKGHAPAPVDAGLADRTSILHASTVLTRGRAEAVVIATGMHTEIGGIAGELRATGQGETPLQQQLHGLGKRLALVAGVAVATFAVLGLLRGQALGETLLSSIALAVAAIPEGLPAVVTVTLAVGVAQMAKRGAIVKRLSSVETLGSTTVVCSDKTGTLTMNEMTAVEVWADGTAHRVSGHGYGADGQIIGWAGAGAGLPASRDPISDLAVAAALCNDSDVIDGELLGDPTEGALTVLADKAGMPAGALHQRSQRLAELPFDSARKLMAVVHRHEDHHLLLAKGAPDVIIDRCALLATSGGPQALTSESRVRVAEEVDRLGRQGLRVLALAHRPLEGSVVPDGEAAVLEAADDMVLLGLVALQDPVRPAARDAVATCHRAGVAVKMITGDHRVTAAAIADELGIRGEVVSGLDVELMTDDELGERVEDIGVFARVAPEHKVRIVRALRDRGHVVAMTGDGVNDAPALKAADIGVAMGIAGTEVSREAAAMVLTDDDFATIVRAVRAGRTIYDNILKFLRFQLSTNLGAIATLVGAQVIGLPVPFTAVQVLWVNIIMDGPPAIALGLDPAGRGVMDRPPRSRGARILTGARLGRLAVLGTVMAVGTLGVLAWGLARGTEAAALSLAFTTFVLFQVVNAFNARDEVASAFSRDALSNRKLLAALAGVLALQVAVVHVGPMGRLFDTVPLTAVEWAVAAAVASTVLLVEEARKAVVRARLRRHLPPTAVRS